MQDKTKKEIIEKILVNHKDLLEGQDDEMFAAYKKAEQMSSGNFSFSVGMATKITPVGSQFSVKSVLSFGVTEKYDIESRIDTEPDFLKPKD